MENRKPVQALHDVASNALDFSKEQQKPCGSSNCNWLMICNAIVASNLGTTKIRKRRITEKRTFNKIRSSSENDLS